MSSSLSRIRVVLALLVVLLPGSARGAQYAFRRWLAPKTFSCDYLPGFADVGVSLANQDVEFANLPPGAQFTINYIDNGVITTDGPFAVEQTSGTKNYGSFFEPFDDYPLRFEFRLDTLFAGAVIYQSSIIISCTSNASGTALIVNRVPVAGIGPFTGTWSGKWKCAVSDNGVAQVLQNKPSTLAIAQDGNDCVAALDGGIQSLRGAGSQDTARASKTRVALAECRTNGFGVSPALNHVIDATFKAGKQPTLTATGAYLSDDGVHRVIGTCKYSYKRVATADPGLFGCVP